VRVLGQRWNVTDDEVARHYPCDDLVPRPAIELWRGVTVRATSAEVWPWLRQVRLAPYSYDWVDNLGRQSPRKLRDLPDPRPGDPFSCIGGRWDVGRVLSAVPGEHLTATILGAVMSYVLVAHGDRTRLLLKVVVERDAWYAGALAAGDWPMARRQLRTLKSRAEST
jgi:hypothetical protein